MQFFGSRIQIWRELYQNNVCTWYLLPACLPDSSGFRCIVRCKAPPDHIVPISNAAFQFGVSNILRIFRKPGIINNDHTGQLRRFNGSRILLGGENHT